MRVSTSSTFDVSSVSDTKTFEEIGPFFDYVNGFTAEVVQAFNKRITFTENMNYSTVPLSVGHGTPINIGRYNPIGIFIKSETPIITYSLTTNPDSTLSITIFFKENHNSLTNAAIWQAGTITRYQIQNISKYSVGDVVVISKFTNPENNGTFLINEIDATNNFIYVNNRNRPDATKDENKAGYSGAQLVTHSVSVGLINA